jgi:predicted MFS family arabinose efflux permease
MAISVGIRAAQGVFVVPMSQLRDWPIGTYSLALAIQNLLWGVIQPLIGMVADDFGARPVIVMGALFYAGGLLLVAWGGEPWATMLGAGVAIGIGLSAASFPVVLALVGRAILPSRRNLAMGLTIAGGSLGQVVLPPLGDRLTEDRGLAIAMLVMAVIALMMIPLALFLRENKAPHGDEMTQNPLAALTSAWTNTGYRLLVLGFFACGFQLAFISIHLPGHLTLCGMSSSAGATALGLMGLFNVAGCWGSGILGEHIGLSRLLAILYGVRVVAVGIFLFLPLSESSLFLFSALIGLTWLATVPLTSGLIARMFGPQYLGTLFGMAFLSHQLGSFLGASAGGWAIDVTGSYWLAWVIACGLGIAAAILHLMIRDHPIPAGVQPG